MNQPELAVLLNTGTGREVRGTSLSPQRKTGGKSNEERVMRKEERVPIPFPRRNLSVGSPERHNSISTGQREFVLGVPIRHSPNL